ncbi:MAG: porphobilinogen synthase, partial [Nitriliruptoraceae bacterium]
RVAIREALADIEQGADVVMVKPALAYLDIIREIRNAVDVPVAAYHVSGEYSMIKAAAERGWIDGDRAMAEATLSIRRAGAGQVLSYAALDLARALQS